MVHTFPNFTPLDIADQEALERIIRSYPPHSDYNLASLWSYDTDSSLKLCLLHNNLVVIFRDYMTDEPILSFLGTNDVMTTLLTLFDYQRKHGMHHGVSLLTKETIASLSPMSLRITEDRDNFDYVVSVTEQIELKGTKFLKKRNKIHAFERDYGNKITEKLLDLTDKNTQNDILTLFTKWEIQSNKSPKESLREMGAIQKLLRSSQTFSLHTIGIFSGESLIGFAIDEVIQDGFGVTHFEKADTNYRGIYEFIKRSSAIHLNTLGCSYINMEQDMGLDGLRAAKLSYRPVDFIKKYTVTSLA